MIVLSQALNYRENRWANIIAGIVTILWVIGGGNTSISYLFFATVEVVCMLLIVWFAWRWPKEAYILSLVIIANLQRAIAPITLTLILGWIR